MKKSINESVLAAAAFLVFFGMNEAALGAGALSQSLANVIGATDSYKITCKQSPDSAIGGTDHLSFKIIDETAVPGTGSIPPQLLNVQLIKGNKKTGFVIANAAAIAPGEKSELDLQGGKGIYKIVVDTVGTNPNIDTKQTFSAEYSCLNDADQFTKPAAARVKTNKIKNNQIKKLNAVCSKSKTAGDTTHLYLKFSNTTVDPSKIALNAQVVTDNQAANVTDINGDSNYSDEISLKGGNGDYKIYVDNTAYDAAQDNSRDYTLQYSCQNAANIDTGEPDVVQTQDQ